MHKIRKGNEIKDVIERGAGEALGLRQGGRVPFIKFGKYMRRVGGDHI